MCFFFIRALGMSLVLCRRKQCDNLNLMRGKSKGVPWFFFSTKNKNNLFK